MRGEPFSEQALPGIVKRMRGMGIKKPARHCLAGPILFGYESQKVVSCSDYSATAESAAQESAQQESAQTVSAQTVSATIESVATVSAAGAALPQDTNDTDAVRAIAATAAKTNFFIIFFYFNLLNNQYAFKTVAKLRTFRVSYLKSPFFFLLFNKKKRVLGLKKRFFM